jgi:hypothetical protein
MLEARSFMMRHRLVLRGALGSLFGVLVALAPAPVLAGARGLRASHAPHGVASGRVHFSQGVASGRVHFSQGVASGRVHFSHGVEVVKGCGFDAPRPGRLGPRPVAHRPLRGVPDPPPGHGFQHGPVVIFVDDGPEVVIDQPGVVIIIE